MPPKASAKAKASKTSNARSKARTPSRSRSPSRSPSRSRSRSRSHRSPTRYKSRSRSQSESEHRPRVSSRPRSPETVSRILRKHPQAFSVLKGAAEQVAKGNASKLAEILVAAAVKETNTSKSKGSKAEKSKTEDKKRKAKDDPEQDEDEESHPSERKAKNQKRKVNSDDDSAMYETTAEGAQSSKATQASNKGKGKATKAKTPKGCVPIYAVILFTSGTEEYENRLYPPKPRGLDALEQLRQAGLARVAEAEGDIIISRDWTHNESFKWLTTEMFPYLVKFLEQNKSRMNGDIHSVKPQGRSWIQHTSWKGPFLCDRVDTKSGYQKRWLYFSTASRIPDAAVNIYSVWFQDPNGSRTPPLFVIEEDEYSEEEIIKPTKSRPKPRPKPKPSASAPKVEIEVIELYDDDDNDDASSGAVNADANIVNLASQLSRTSIDENPGISLPQSPSKFLVEDIDPFGFSAWNVAGPTRGSLAFSLKAAPNDVDNRVDNGDDENLWF